MKQSNIDFLLEMTKDYLEGKIDSISYSLDFPYEVEKRYGEIAKVDKEMAELIYDCLVEDGAYQHDTLIEEEFREKIEEEYLYVRGVYMGDMI